MARIICPSCGKGIAPASVDLSTRLAKCECGDVFAFGEQVRGRVEPVADARRRALAAPPGWTVGGEAHASGTDAGYRAAAGTPGEPRVLTRRWLRPHAIFLALVCLVWDSLLVVWYGIALELLSTGQASTGVLVLMLVLPLLHVAVGVGLTYYTLALFLNRTVVELGSGEARVQHGPLRWRGSKQVSLAGLRRVFVRREEGPLRPRSQRSWVVLLDTDANPAVPLLSGLPTFQDARFVAAHLAEGEQVAGP